MSLQENNHWLSTSNTHREPKKLQRNFTVTEKKFGHTEKSITFISLKQNIKIMKQKLTCCLCQKEITDGFGNNPRPLGEKRNDRCCDDCNRTKVIPERFKFLETKIK